MQHSKLPVRIKKKHGDKKCCCAQLLKAMRKEGPNTSCAQNGSLKNPDIKTVGSQTDVSALLTDAQKKSYQEVKGLLLSINCTLEHILHLLQDKKDFLYGKLQEEAAGKRLKTYFNKTKSDKAKKKHLQIAKKFTYTWPEICRLYYGQPPWLKHYMQKIDYDIPSTNSNLVICPRRDSWKGTARPFSCSDINYFQPMGRIMERKPFGISMYPNPLLTLTGQGDLNGSDFKGLD